MLKKTIAYTNFNGEERQQDFYFHLGKAELLEFIGSGAFEGKLQKMIDSKDNIQILREFQRLVSMAIGVRSEDGETFVKNDEVRQRLMSSPAYDELLMELVTDPVKGAEFVKGLLPENMRQDLEKKLAEQDNSSTASQDNKPDWVRENRQPTKDEISKMSPQELSDIFAGKFGTKKD
jgi:hypothetical protein